MKDKLQKNAITVAGEVSLDSLIITTNEGTAVNVKMQCTGIELYEDMGAPFMNGILLLHDAQDLVSKLPIIGQETLDIEFSIPGSEKYTGQFRIFKLDKRTKVHERDTVYTLHFISVEAYTDINKKVSRAYQGMIHDIIRDVVTSKDGLGSTKKLNIEESSNKTKFISNFWSPKQIIEFASKRAVNKDGMPTYVFFENKNGFNFVSLDSLYDVKEPYFKFKRDNYSAEVLPTGGSQRSIEEDYKRIVEINSLCGFNYIEQLRKGMYGSEVVYFDTTTHQYVQAGYTPKWEDGKHLNEEPIGRDVYAQFRSVLIHEKQAYNNFNDYATETSTSKTIQKRKALMARAEAYGCTVTVFGNPNISAGQKVYIEMPVMTQQSMINQQDQEIVDKVQSGNYLIASVCHKISSSKYLCVMDLIKDSHMAGVYAK